MQTPIIDLHYQQFFHASFCTSLNCSINAFSPPARLMDSSRLRGSKLTALNNGTGPFSLALLYISLDGGHCYLRRCGSREDWEDLSVTGETE